MQTISLPRDPPAHTPAPGQPLRAGAGGRSYFIYRKKTVFGTPLTWPAKSALHCFWCVHPFDAPPRPCPVAYDDYRKYFRVRGIFCSWGCSRAYSHREIGTARSAMAFTMLIQTLYGSWHPVRAAPRREALDIFGGPLDIAAFRRRDTLEPRFPMPVLFGAERLYDPPHAAPPPARDDSEEPPGPPRVTVADFIRPRLT